MYIHVHTCTMIKYSIYVPIDLPNCPKENRPRHITTTTAAWPWIPSCVHQLFSYAIPKFRNGSKWENPKPTKTNIIQAHMNRTNGLCFANPIRFKTETVYWYKQDDALCSSGLSSSTGQFSAAVKTFAGVKQRDMGWCPTRNTIKRYNMIQQRKMGMRQTGVCIVCAYHGVRIW